MSDSVKTAAQRGAHTADQIERAMFDCDLRSEQWDALPLSVQRALVDDALTVRAVNNHERLTAENAALVAALRQIERLGRKGATTVGDRGDPMQYALADIARAALAKVGAP